MKKEKIVVLSGAGVSAESGLKTFRGNNGLWEGYRVEEVATPEAWQANPSIVQEFYNHRRKACKEAEPNGAHLAIANLEKNYEVIVITQNVDDLHERAGRSFVLHLHGELMKSRSTVDANLVYPIKGDRIEMGELCEKGSQLRPHIVWFGESVPLMEQAIHLIRDADIILVIGTSLMVYPAAGLMHYAPNGSKLYLIDPNAMEYDVPNGTVRINEKAVKGMKILLEMLTK